MRRALLLTVVLLTLTGTCAQNWDVIRSSGQYYWGVGQGTTVDEATQSALVQMTAMIVTHVKSEFNYLADDSHRQGSHEFDERVNQCVRTYSQATLTGVEFFEPEGRAPNITRRCFMPRSRMEQVFADRTAKARSMVALAEEALQLRKVDIALQYYYWAYSLLRSLQRPAAVTDQQGRILVDRLPLLIDNVLSDIAFSIDTTDGDRVNIIATYQGQPVQGLEFTYNDGRSLCHGTAKDGRAMMEMVGSIQHEAYHLSVDYECRDLARGDAEIESVLSVVPTRFFPRANITLTSTATASGGFATGTEASPVRASGGFATGTEASPARASGGFATGTVPPPALTLSATPNQLADDSTIYANVIDRIMRAVSTSRYSDVTDCFTLEGLQMWNQLIAYGRARITGTPQLRYYRSNNGGVVARGMQMTFTFNRGLRRTFVEDVALTFNQNGKIDNVAFGLGQQTTNSLMNHEGYGWTDEVKEILTEFLESYKSAYCLQRLDYLRQVFADDATIIVGHVARSTGRLPNTGDNSRHLSVGGQDVITYNRYTKDEYLSHLEQIFHRNEFINLRFTECDARWLEMFRGKQYGQRELFAIQIGQDYTSTTYSDMGYLFLLVDLTNPAEPTIHIRTWQPNEVDLSRVFSAGDFYE